MARAATREGAPGKRKKDFIALLEEEGNKEIRVSENGRARKITKKEALTQMVYNELLKKADIKSYIALIRMELTRQKQASATPAPYEPTDHEKMIQEFLADFGDIFDAETKVPN